VVLARVALVLDGQFSLGTGGDAGWKDKAIGLPPASSLNPKVKGTSLIQHWCFSFLLPVPVPVLGVEFYQGAVREGGGGG